MTYSQIQVCRILRKSRLHADKASSRPNCNQTAKMSRATKYEHCRANVALSDCVVMHCIVNVDVSE